MPKTPHWAIFLSNNTNKIQLVSALIKGEFAEELAHFKHLKGVLFSETILKEFIEQENRFGQSEIIKKPDQNIATHSGGEQKKALLNYCISQKADYILLDNPYDNLDITSQKSLSILLDNVSKTTTIIQLVNRNSDLLPFVQQAFYINPKGEYKFINKINEFIDSVHNQIVEICSNKIPEPILVNNFADIELVNFKKISVSYNDRAIIKNIEWQINKNEFWQLIGPNGAGKTTILSMIIGDNPKAFGQDITLFGVKKGSGESVWDLKKKIGYFTPSMTDLFARNTTLEHMIVSGIFDSIGLYKMPTERQLRLAKEWLNVLEMNHLCKKPFYKLTAGQQRLTMIARAMVKHPPLLILDEPTAGLDDNNALLVSQLINKIASESQTSIIYVSHRNEPGLKPQYVYELLAGENGSTGRVISQTD
jgi:molybdate transport system ATP-binding protein